MFTYPTFLSVYSVLGIVLNLGNAEMNKDTECVCVVFFFSSSSDSNEGDRQTIHYHKVVWQNYKRERKEYDTLKKRDT